LNALILKGPKGLEGEWRSEEGLGVPDRSQAQIESIALHAFDASYAFVIAHPEVTLVACIVIAFSSLVYTATRFCIARIDNQR